MRQVIFALVVSVSFLGSEAPFELCAQEHSTAKEVGATQSRWVRRCGQIAKISPQMVSKFKTAAAPDGDITTRMELLHLRNHNMFFIELTPGEFYAFRYFEYDGQDYLNDMRKLHQEPQYSKWMATVDACLEDRWADVEDVFYTRGRANVKPPDSGAVRIAQVVGLRPNMVEPYKLLHAHTWPGVLAAIREGNIRNYSIFLAKIGLKLYLFAYFEYAGSDFKSDMATIGADPDTRAWIKLTDDGCQLPLSTRQPGEWWARMEPVSTPGDTRLQNEP